MKLRLPGVFGSERALLLLAVPVLAVVALSLSSHAHSTVAPRRAGTAVTAASAAATAPPSTQPALGDPAPGTPATTLPAAGERPIPQVLSATSRRSLAAPTNTPTNTSTNTSALPGESPAPTVSESQSPIFLVLVGILVVIIAGWLWLRSGRRRAPQDGST